MTSNFKFLDAIPSIYFITQYFKRCRYRALVTSGRLRFLIFLVSKSVNHALELVFSLYLSDYFLFECSERFVFKRSSCQYDVQPST